MAGTQSPVQLLDEIADFLASNPTPEQLLGLHPSEATQQRARDLLAKHNAGRLTAQEQRQLDQFEHTEVLMRLVKARIHARKAKKQAP